MKSNRRKITLEKHARIRRTVIGTSERPRLSVYRSGKNIYAQIIDDTLGRTLISSSSLEQEIKANIKFGGNCEASELVGKNIAKKSLDKGISQVVFDRGGYLYHGRIKALADAARSLGLNF
uniref:ribosomal protein L18 n=1 Tax=Porphyridium aerugineum TaxID=2792 RepID=UPI001FCDD38D|nr:ribosomal protein L18 [Porphyridium aerugineum]UNJ17876.1 ribosomal protein L18 [Porphyridium aerugineum]